MSEAADASEAASAETRSSPVLSTQRLVLRQPDPSEAALALAYYERNRVHHARWDPPRPAAFYTLSHWEGRLERNRLEFFQGRTLRLFLFERERLEGPILGSLNLSNIVRGCFHACVLGYSLDKDVVGRGYMSEALSALCTYAFEDLGLHRIEANYVPTNERSGAVLRRCGFTVQGYARDYLYIGGAWRDHVLTARTSPDASPPGPDRERRRRG